jgi:hypothetical protein
MIKIPAQYNLEHPPGQVVYSPAQTVNDQINRMNKDGPIKLSFDQWWQKARYVLSDVTRYEAREIWQAAQDNR